MTVDQLKAQRRTKKSSFNTYAKRRNDIRDIIKNIDNKLDDDVRDVNKQISNCISELQNGLKGTSKVGTICDEMEKSKEGGTGSGNIASCRSNLSREVSRCQGRINALDTEIKTLENQIRAQGGTIYFWE